MSSDFAPAPAPAVGLGVIWCDFGGVLTPPLDEAIAQVVAASGVPWSVLMEAATRVAHDLDVTGLRPLELGLISQAEWGALLEKALPIGTVSQVDLGRWDEYWYRDRPLNTELLGELHRLTDAGVRVGMLTNSVAEWEPHRAKMLAGVDVFEAWVRSHEIGLAKPDPRIFAHADEKLSPSGSVVVLIDDIAANCLAARAHGWTSIHHVSTKSTIAELHALLLK
ncbi:HAD-IA family hydrolase [Salinibacterium sp. M195]|uniref:HAD-IA family hydrolase n=1 Tax=Salinibacterium sp. M195 TaxID=2583374 RepID=UPI001C62C0EE|nr:HAD-IA family hydrolase [Salinibacterium sp. M195]